MPAYWITHVSVTDEASYAEYAKRAGPAIAAFGGEFLARGGVIGSWRGRDRPRNVLVRFPDIETAEACYNSPDYQAALEFARDASERDLVLVEGLLNT